MPFVCLVIEVPNVQIQDLNDRCQFPTKVEEAMQGNVTLIQTIQAGNLGGIMQVTTRDTDPGISTSGAGSQQYTYNHK